MGQNHPKFFLSHFIKLSHILANYTKGQVAKLIRTILKMSLELTYRIWITLYKGDGYCDDPNNNCGCDWDGGDCCGNNVDTLFCTTCKCLDPNQVAGC